MCVLIHTLKLNSTAAEILTWTEQELVLLSLEYMVFHELLELLHFLNPHLSMSVLEAVPV